MFFKKTGILGINARNLLYLRPYNEEKSIELADDKLKTKAFLSARGIPVPKLLGVINNYSELDKFSFNKLGSEFVLKPNLGFGGEGIIPIIGKTNKHFLGPKNQSFSSENLKTHIIDILNGNYSLSNQPDKAFFEKLIVSDEILGQFSYQGLPDIRIIVHNLVPVMAMLRIPTQESKGKANLHQGAVGAGIDLAKGEVTHLCYKNNIIQEVPEKGPIRGLKIPYWDDILHMACQAQLATNLGYIGVDIALDRQQGPQLLEINARSGIGIQIANMAPLRRRLEKLEDVNVTSIAKGIRIAKDMFGYSLEKDIKNISGKKVIGIFEKVEILNKQKEINTIAFINTSKKKSSISIELAKELNLIKSKKIRKEDQENKYKLKIKLNGEKLTSFFQIENFKKKKYQMAIGRRDISGKFLVDTSIKNMISEKTNHESKNFFISSYSPLETDRQLCKISQQIKLLSYLKPVNLEHEIIKFKLNNDYNPQFRYKKSLEEYETIKKNLQNIKYDDSEIGHLFENKIKELQLQLELINSIGSNEFTENSKLLFGSPNETEIHSLNSKPPKKSNKKQIIYTSHQLKEIFENVLLEYGIKDARVIFKNRMLSKCMANKSKKILIKADSTFKEDRVKQLIIHELETHLLTSENGSKQKYRLFNYGFANYLPTQEGLAVYNDKTYGPNNSKEDNYINTLTKALYLGNKNSFSGLYHKLREYKISTKNSLYICMRVKRGLGDTSKPGTFSKDYCYDKGEKQIRQFVNEGGNLSDLYFGKYNLDDLDLIKQVTSISRPPILPKWLDN